MIFEKTIVIDRKEAEYIDYLLTHEPESEAECFTEDRAPITYTAVFPNGYEVDVRVCGVQYWPGECNLPWTEAILLAPGGHEVSCSEPDDHLDGEWIFWDHDENQYNVTVIMEGFSR